ncbi:MAG: helicase RepA family protein [Methylacidiphilales bacterium]|nr:helicase RepA family protein [Candidatus Methylacidiphilales bacterium]
MSLRDGLNAIGADAETSGTETLRTLLPETIDAAGLILDELPPDPPFIVEGIFHQGSKLVLAGSSKAGKTWSLIDLALSVASGREWWGFKTNQCTVLYVNFEIQPEFFHRRVALIKKTRAIELAPGALQIIHLRGKRLTAELFGQAIKERFEQAGFGLVILDPLYKLMVGKEENSTATLSSVADVIDGIASRCNAAVAYGAHFSKGNQSAKEIADRINGSGVAGRDADSILTLTKHTEEDCASLEAVLRNCPPMPAKVMRWNFPLMEEAKELDPADLKKPGGRPEAISTVKTLEIFGRQNTMTRQELLREAAKMDVSEATMDRKLRELVKTGELQTTKGSGLYVKA